MQSTVIYINGNKKRCWEPAHVSQGRVKALQALSMNKQVSLHDLLRESGLTYAELMDVMSPWIKDRLLTSEIYYTLHGNVQVITYVNQN